MQDNKDYKNVSIWKKKKNLNLNSLIKVLIIIIDNKTKYFER
jgi:hypothetical protein